MAKTQSNPRLRAPPDVAQPHEALRAPIMIPFLNASCREMAARLKHRKKPVIWGIGAGVFEVRTIRHFLGDKAHEFHLVDIHPDAMRRINEKAAEGTAHTVHGSVLQIHPRKRPHAAFMHNLVDYFDHEQQQTIASDIVDALHPGGTLHYTWYGNGSPENPGSTPFQRAVESHPDIDHVKVLDVADGIRLCVAFKKKRARR